MIDVGWSIKNWRNYDLEAKVTLLQYYYIRNHGVYEILFHFQAFVAIGDHDGHVGLGVKCSKEVATAIRGAIILAKLSVVPVRRGYWGNKIGKPHTVPCKVRLGPVFDQISLAYSSTYFNCS
jgi:hypothetical protein